MPTELTVDAILFDSDGVLVDSHQRVEVAWRLLAAEFDLDGDRLLRELVGRRADDTLSAHLPPGPLEEAVARLEDLEVSTAAGTPPIPGAVALLDGLPAHRWAIVTSASRRLASARWRGAGIPVPDTVVTAEDVTRGKPDPEPFVTGARRLGVDPARCLVLEDSAPGGEAARSAGAAVVAVGAQPWTVAPTARIGDLTAMTLVSSPDGSLRVRLA